MYQLSTPGAGELRKDSPRALCEVASLVDARISSLLAEEVARWSCLDQEMVEPLSTLRTLVLSGGKRLRPAFLYWSYRGLGGEPDDSLPVDAGAALELLHTFALIHDDVMDASSRRHGVETAHVEYRRRHREAEWAGDPARFGRDVAILVGDLAFVYSDTLMTHAPRAAHEVWNEMRLEANLGQYLDLVGTAKRSASPELARRICQYKSAKYSVERPLHLGAALADPSGWKRLAGELSDFGLPLGEAFQLKDDLLGVFGNPEITGKPVGEDLREGKPTLLYALALAAARDSDAWVLESCFGKADLGRHDVESLREVFERTGARAQVEKVIASLVERSMIAAASLPVTPAASVALEDLTRFVAGRDR